jgi:anhydro-N-acetylmuramic acid kinase
MIVAGVMSGTSADGIDVALVRISRRGFNTRFKLLRHEHYSYPQPVRRFILQAMNAQTASVADLARLNCLLGEIYSDALSKTRRKANVAFDLVGCHGQTIYHQGERQIFLGKKIACTWQTGEGALIAARVGAPVISDFRPADMAAGGKGAPLVPFLDYLLFRDRRKGRIVQNIGGIANFSAIPAGAAAAEVIALDTGPGNMVIDALTERFFGKRYDRDGRIAARGRVSEDVVRRVLRQPFFRQKPPRTAGREEFGREFVAEFMHYIKNNGQRAISNEDIVATATALTAASIADAIQRFVVSRNSKLETRDLRSWDMIASGGGTRNQTLMRMLNERLRNWRIKVRTTDDFGLPAEAKEAVAFAILAYQTWNRQAGNIPSATGAGGPAVLGKISYPPLK